MNNQQFSPADWVANFISLGGQIATKDNNGKAQFCLIIPAMELSLETVSKVESFIELHYHTLTINQHTEVMTWLDSLSHSIGAS